MPVPVKATTSANALVVLRRDKAQGNPILMYKVRIPTDQVATRNILMELMRARFTSQSYCTFELAKQHGRSQLQLVQPDP